MPKTSVVILNWNGSHFLQQFLPTLLQYTDLSETEIVVADNASSDNSIELLRLQFPQVRILQFEKNHGFAAGYNIALSQLNAEYYVILNSDVEVSANWLKPLIAFLDQHDNVAALMPKILNFNKKNYFEYAGASGGFIDFLGYPFCRGRIFETLEEDNGQYNAAIEIFWATGACMVIRANVFHQVGGFDESFFAHMEEIDLCWRIQQLGYKIMCLPQSVVYHVGGGALPNKHPFKLYLNFRNNLFLLYKNLPHSKLFKTILLRIIFDYVAAILFLLKFQFPYFLSIIKAQFYFLYAIKNLQHYRNKNNLLLNNQLTHNIYNKSIIIQYFIKNKKNFSELKFNNNSSLN